jgi:hypothetical protein
LAGGKRIKTNRLQENILNSDQVNLLVSRKFTESLNKRNDRYEYIH